MYIPIIVKSDHSLLNSMIKIDNLINFCVQNNITSCGICDNNLFGAIEFYKKCSNNKIKPLLGLNLKYNDINIYLYAKNYEGYQNLLHLNTLMQKESITSQILEEYNSNIKAVILFDDKDLFDDINNIYEEVYIGYSNEYEKNNALIITRNILFAPVIKAIDKDDCNYLQYLEMIDVGTTVSNYQSKNYKSNYLQCNYDEEDTRTSHEFARDINIIIPTDKVYIPKFSEEYDSTSYLYTLAYKGLQKRLNNQENIKYKKRLEYELSVIKQMGFVDYFLIVYDYILYAKKNNIYVGPGRGSAAGCLVAYCLGITDIDPIKYNLLFERFLNKERVTMPDIDVDFEDTKRNQVITYLHDKYGQYNVANIMTYGTLGSKQVIRDVARVLEYSENMIIPILKNIDAKISLMDNYKIKPKLQEIIKKDSRMQKLYKIALKLEGLKRQISTHAAGVVISSQELDNLIPMVVNQDNVLTGTTMEYLEDFGFIKMDLLAIRNLRTIHEIVDLIKNEEGITIKISDIPLDDAKTIKLFTNADTQGIFQYESEGMKSFLKKLRPTSFEDLISAIALYRPGPMDNIPEFIKRKDHEKKVTYIHKDLEDILSTTYGIIVYQEQIMQILVKVGGYSFADADNIRRAMSKKKKDVMDKEREIFINKAMQRGYEKNVVEQIYDLIVKFANYGFNKSHSVAYALIGYQMAYLKAHYPMYFYTNLLNASISSEIKTQEYLTLIKQKNIKVYSPNINKSTNIYRFNKNNLLLPLGVIKNIGSTVVEEILNEREKGEFSDFFDFVKRCYGKSVTKKVIEYLIFAGAFNDFKVNKKTLVTAIDNAITYAELTKDMDSPLILKPQLEVEDEYLPLELIAREKEVLGFYVSNHPASRYKEGIVKLDNIQNYFDKFIKCVVLVNRINNITTKNGKNMCFLDGEDETRTADFVIFPNKNGLLTKFKQGDLVMISGKVEKRLDKYQIVVSNLEKIK